MYTFFNTTIGQCIFLIDPFLSLIQINVYFLLSFFIINRGQCMLFFNTNTGQCIVFIDLFLSLIEVNVYF